ncbi:hypothetical protein [Rheinheimera maricola]|uniref:PAS domain-containing protein n=1 Tax=Rheinheimera maricola TaxID=2793282 RepID=A0ABS7X8E1_9GAMM|nr:hypothetical protein [Rheinheimera maricola]MBZ9611814.1 hypothetical protein [Rheinheimera maricola]
MTDKLTPPPISNELRQRAEQQLRTGTAQLNNASTASSDALGALYRLSSTANTASDGLKLLHELQTYQVELDVQLEQLQHDEREHSQELSCYRQFFAICPLACLMLSLNGTIIAANDAAGRLFSHAATNVAEHASESLCGRPVFSLFCPSCQPMLSAALAKVQRNQQSATLIATPVSRAAEPRSTADSMQLSITLSPDHNTILIMLT